MTAPADPPLDPVVGRPGPIEPGPFTRNVTRLAALLDALERAPYSTQHEARERVLVEVIARSLAHIASQQ